MGVKPKKPEEFSNFIIAYEFSLGLIEIILGVGIWALGSKVFGIYRVIQDSDVLGEQHEILINSLAALVPYVFSHRFYLITLLIALGGVKIVSSIGLWTGKGWGKHLLIWLLIVLIPFDLVGIIRHFTLLDVGYLILDILIILYMVNFKPKEYFFEVRKLFN